MGDNKNHYNKRHEAKKAYYAHTNWSEINQIHKVVNKQNNLYLNKFKVLASNVVLVLT